MLDATSTSTVALSQFLNLGLRDCGLCCRCRCTAITCSEDVAHKRVRSCNAIQNDWRGVTIENDADGGRRACTAIAVAVAVFTAAATAADMALVSSGGAIAVDSTRNDALIRHNTCVDCGMAARAAAAKTAGPAAAAIRAVAV